MLDNLKIQTTESLETYQCDKILDILRINFYDLAYTYLTKAISLFVIFCSTGPVSKCVESSYTLWRS
jgi:hypothetical protein